MTPYIRSIEEQPEGSYLDNPDYEIRTSKVPCYNKGGFDLRTCPHCYNLHYLNFDTKFIYDTKLYFIHCSYCGGDGPALPTPELAAKAWNYSPRYAPLEI